MNPKWLAMAAAVLVISAVAAFPAGAAAEEASPEAPAMEEVAPFDETCNSGHVCVWVEFNYQGAKGESLCTGGVHTLTGIKGSAKNRCANKASWLRLNGFTVGCVNPANNFPVASSGFNELWIGAEGSRC
jgi:hypothetical protein